MTGAVVSRTVTVKPQLFELELASVTEQLTGVVPSGKRLPDAGVQMTWRLVVSHTSLAVVTKLTAVPTPPAHSTTRLVEQAMVGAVVSRTVMMKLQELELPCASTAEQRTVVMPIEKVLPDAGWQTGTIAPSQESFAVVT